VEGMISSSSSSLPSPVAQFKSIEAEDRLSSEEQNEAASSLGTIFSHSRLRWVMAFVNHFAAGAVLSSTSTMSQAWSWRAGGESKLFILLIQENTIHHHHHYHHSILVCNQIRTEDHHHHIVHTF
jgi:hypothetical protein